MPIPLLMGFLGYHQIKITPEDRRKMNFATEWGCFQYTVMPFGLKNAPAIFSCVVIATFKEFIHKFMEVYFDESLVFGLVKRHVAILCLILDTCRRYQIVLNLKKIHILCSFWDLARSCCVQARIDGGPYKDCGNCELGGP